MKEKVMDILMDLRPDVDFENGKKLIGDGILESFDIMSLVAELEDEFDVKIKPKDLVAENFNSVDDMVAMLAFAEKYPLGIEMGRYLAAPCGTYASRVMDIKNNSDTNYIICDGGIHHLKYHGQTMAMQVPEMEVLNTSAETKPYCICGSLCTVADVLVREVELPIVSRNDVILFHRCGAYSVTEGSALFLSRKMPEVYLYNEVTGLEKMRSFVDAADINRKE